MQAPECLLMRVMERLDEVDELQLFVDNCGTVAMDTGRGSSDVLLRHMKGEYLSVSIAEYVFKYRHTLFSSCNNMSFSRIVFYFFN